MVAPTLIFDFIIVSPKRRLFSVFKKAHFCAQKKALIEVLKTLDNYVEKEMTDICECDQCIELTQERTGPLLLNLHTSPYRLYDGFSLYIYSDAIAIYSFETREVAYFRLQEGAGETIRSLIMEAIK